MNKNAFFLVTLLCTQFAYSAQETFTPKKFTLTYTLNVDANDQSRDVLVNMMNNVHRSSNFYSKLTSFIKELKEAIAAGLTLFNAVATIEESPLEIVSDVAQAALESAIDTTSTEKSQTVLTYTIASLKPADETNYNEAKNMLQNLAQALNSNESTVEQVIALVEEIHNVVENVASEGTISTMIANMTPEEAAEKIENYTELQTTEAVEANVAQDVQAAVETVESSSAVAQAVETAQEVVSEVFSSIEETLFSDK
ncbi:hypothetical protein KBD08_01280 [Candidatus Babeliales bacterium]|nr:hypothetical protein [Candidatus Babeliales bacterium]